jgi:GxxExxY protein
MTRKKRIFTDQGMDNEIEVRMLFEELTGKIIKAFYKVYNTLGYGFLEKVYANAIAFELQNLGLVVLQEQPITVYYEGREIGVYRTVLIVESKVIVEIKAVSALIDAHKNQTINYLKATRMEVGLVLNFGPSPEVKRVILSSK